MTATYTHPLSKRVITDEVLEVSEGHIWYTVDRNRWQSTAALKIHHSDIIELNAK